MNNSGIILIIFVQTTLGIARGIVYVTAYAAILMKLCSNSIEGFMFTIFTSAMNFGKIIILPKIIAYFGDSIGISMIPALFTMAPVMLIGILTVPSINKSIEARQIKRIIKS